MLLIFACILLEEKEMSDVKVCAAAHQLPVQCPLDKDALWAIASKTGMLTSQKGGWDQLFTRGLGAGGKRLF